MNWIDGVFIAIFVIYVLGDMHRGFLRLSADLAGLILAFIAALFLYIPTAVLIAANFGLNADGVKPASFLIIWLILQLIFFGVSKIISYYTPAKIKESKTNYYLAVLPAMAKSIFFIIMIVILLLSIPFSDEQRRVISQSFITNYVSKYAVSIEAKLEKVFGNPTSRLTLTNSTENSDTETTPLNFSTANMVIDEPAEQYLLDQINLERRKAGLNLLVSDDLVRNVARAHSRDMLLNGYFSHTAKDGQTLFDRLVRANVDFRQAAENLALTTSPELAQVGLMNSPKHRDNILNPNFTRVGIGVMNAGKYGLMTTEDFAN